MLSYDGDDDKIAIRESHTQSQSHRSCVGSVWFDLIWLRFHGSLSFKTSKSHKRSSNCIFLVWNAIAHFMWSWSLISCSSWLCLLTFHPAVVAYHAVMDVSVVFSHIPSLPMVLLARALDSLYSYPFQTIWISIFLSFNSLDTFCSHFGRSLSVRFYCLFCGCGFGFNSYQI